METAIENLPAVLPQVNGAAVILSQQGNNPLAMPVSPRFVVDRYNAIQEIVREVFKKGVHFGEIPGTAKDKDGNAKMVLLKPGFDALCTAFQFSPDFIKQPESVESSDFINLVYKCVLTSASGRVVATGIGSCNSKEEKYRWINMARKCPACGKEAIGKSKEEWGGGWYCNAKKDGCGAKFKKGERAIEEQEAGRRENDNAWNHHNTLTKMSQKRAGMAAIITACGLSSDFTQDVEDFEVPHDKAKRGEAGIEIQATVYPEDTPHGHGMDRPFYEEEDTRPSGESADYRPVPPNIDEFNTRGGPAPEPDSLPLFAEPAPGTSADVLAAYSDIVKELAYCKTKEDFQKTKGLMQSRGGSYLAPQVTQLVNARYRQLFPAPAAQKGK